MKTILFFCISFLFSAGVSFTQNHQHELDHLFEDYSLRTFESDLGLQREDYANTTLLDFIDEQYQLFFQVIRSRVVNGEEISEELFTQEYNIYVSEVLNQLHDKKGKVLPAGTPKAADGPCVNMDFETGDFTGWELTRGDVDGSVPYSYVGEFSVGPSAYHTVYNSGTDGVTGISRVFPGAGTNSVRLGNGTGTGARGARMRQTFLVDSSNYMYTYNYAVVFQSPAGHTLNELPYFTVRVFDQAGNSIPCGEYSVIASEATAPDFDTTTFGSTIVMFKDWSTVFTNLASYIGQNVTVEFTAGDCSLGGHFGYAYIDAACGADSIIASSNLICAGDVTTLTAPPGAAAYSWNTGDTTQIINVSNSGTYTCTLTPFQGGLCNVVLDITITLRPSPTAQFNGSPLSACVGDTISFNNTSFIANPGVISAYRWDFGDGNITPNGTGAIVGTGNTYGTYLNPNHYYSTSGNYTIELYAVSSDGCEDSVIRNIVINALPVVVAGVDQEVCEGEMVTLSGSGALSYSWNNGVTNNIPFAPPLGTTSYTVTGTNMQGCSNTDDVLVTVNPLPNVSAGLDQQICDSSWVTLTGSGALTFVWDQGVSDGIPFQQGIGMITYTVTGTDINGCQNNDQVNVTVNSIPNVDAGNDETICEGEEVILSGSGALTYTWTGGITDGIPFIPGIGINTYIVTGTDTYGCQNTDTVEINVNPLPVVDAGIDTILCEGDSIILIGTGALSYVWDNGINNGVAFVPTVGSTTYTVTGTDANGCQNSDAVVITVNPLPVVDAGMDQNTCDSTLITLFGSGALDYSWDHGILDGEPFYQTIGTISYTVIGTDANGCQNTDQVTVTVNGLPIAEGGQDQEVCEGVAIVLSGNGTGTLNWDNGITDGIPFVPSPGITPYVLTGIDQNGCIDTDTVFVTVNENPPVDAGPDLVVCEGDTVVLTATGADDHYTWDNNVINGVPFIQPVGMVLYHVTGFNSTGCFASDSVTVTVNPRPVVYAGADVEVCESNFIILTAVGTSNLYWNNGITNAIPFQQEAGSFEYIVTDSLSNGCTSTDTVIVTVHPRPVIEVNDTTICIGSEVTLTATGALSYEWTGGIQNGVPFIPEQTTQYIVTGTNAPGCQSMAMATVTVGAYPEAGFDWINKDLSTSDLVSDFDNLSTGATEFQWYFGDGTPYSYEFEPTHEFQVEEGGVYVVQLMATSVEGCTSLATELIHIRQDYALFAPNTFTPDGDNVNEIFEPKMFGFDKDKYTLLIFNRWGEVIFESHDMTVGWDGTYGINAIEPVEDGVYNWKIIARVINEAENRVFVGHVSLLR